MARCHDGMTLVADLTEVTFVDSVGDKVLSFFSRFGAEFVTQTSYTLDICERLHLRLAPGRAPDANTSGASRAKLVDAGPTYVSRKTRKSENVGKYNIARITM